MKCLYQIKNITKIYRILKQEYWKDILRINLPVLVYNHYTGCPTMNKTFQNKPQLLYPLKLSFKVLRIIVYI